MKLKELLVFWVAISAFLLLFVWIFGDVMLPFVAGIIIAYLLTEGEDAALRGDS